jgi:uncharacterized repeat protein (TIGR01451 family)
MRKNKDDIRKNLAIAEIVGTIIMLGIATSSISVLYYQVSSTPIPVPAPIIETSGTIEDNMVIVTHRGGEPIDIESEIVLSIGGELKSFKLKDFLDSESKQDGVWSLSEKVVYPISYDDFDYSVNPNIDINVFDFNSGSLVMTGITEVNPTCDLGIEIFCDNLNPIENELITFTIRITNYANINSSGALIEFLLPEGLTYHSSIMDQGTYDSNAGIWETGKILKTKYIELEVKATVNLLVYGTPTQLVFLLDGSASISPSNWTTMKTGLATAVKDERRFPKSGVVELTIIQYGGKSPAYAQLEIGPIIVTEENVDSIVNDILNIVQIGEKTPTSCAVYLAADALKNSAYYSPSKRQIILMVTDGNPTHSCGYDGDYVSSNDVAPGPKDAVIEAVEFLVKYLQFTEGEDEFNSLSIGLTGFGHAIELCDYVVWPQPGYYFPDEYPEQSGGGWVRNVSSWKEFAISVNETLELIFNKIPIDVNIKSTQFTDPKLANDLNEIIITPQLTLSTKSVEPIATQI